MDILFIRTEIFSSYLVMDSNILVRRHINFISLLNLKVTQGVGFPFLLIQILTLGTFLCFIFCFSLHKAFLDIFFLQNHSDK